MVKKYDSFNENKEYMDKECVINKIKMMMMDDDGRYWNEIIDNLLIK